MSVVISIALQKGGTGKSTTAQALASTLGFEHKRVLLIDMDAQRNVTYASNVDDPQWTVFDILNGDCKSKDALVRCKYYDLLSSDTKLTNIEMAEGVEATILKDVTTSLLEAYDFIIIDTPPALGNLSYASLVMSDYVIIPIDPRPFALQGLGALNKTIESVQNSLNPNLKILGILLIKYNSRAVLNRDIKGMIEEYAKRIHTVVFQTTIRSGIAVAEAQTVRQPLMDYAKTSKVNADYEAFTLEVLQIIGA